MAKSQPKPEIEVEPAFDLAIEAAQVIEDSTRPDADASLNVDPSPTLGAGADALPPGPAGLKLNKDGSIRKKRTSKFDQPQIPQPAMSHHMSAGMFNGILAMLCVSTMGNEAAFTSDEKKALDAALGDYLKMKNVVAPPGAVLAATYAVVLLGKLQKPTVRERVFSWLEKTKGRFMQSIKRGEK